MDKKIQEQNETLCCKVYRAKAYAKEIETFFKILKPYLEKSSKEISPFFKILDEKFENLNKALDLKETV